MAGAPLFGQREMARESRREVTVTERGGDNKERLCHRERRGNVNSHIMTPEIFRLREEAPGA